MRIWMVLGTILLSACSGAAETAKTETSPGLSSVLMDKQTGCMEGDTAQFGRYVGDWDIQDWQLSREDGKTWNEHHGARWNFTCVGNGLAIQDFWMPNNGGLGTNLRIFNPETESWDIVWTATGAPGTMRINAKEQADGSLLMQILSPEQNPPRRIIFYPPDETGWDWAQEMSFDGGENWTKVYKIRATPRASQ